MNKQQTVHQKLAAHLAELESSRTEAFNNGEWALVDALQLCIDDTRDDIKAQELIEAIKAKPGYQVFPGSGNNIVVVYSCPSAVKQHSVWLGRRDTINSLQSILSSAK